MESGENINNATLWNTVPSSPDDVLTLYSPEVTGLKAACGLTIGSICEHAAERITERNVTLSTLVDVVKTAPITYPDRNPTRICQQKDNWKIVFSRVSGDIITVVDLDG